MPRTSLIPISRIRALYRRCRSAVSSAEVFRPVGEAVDCAGELSFFADVLRVTVLLDQVTEFAEPPHCGPVRGRAQWAGGFAELRADHERRSRRASRARNP